MELGSLLGLILGIGFILVSILITGEWQPSALMAFADAPSIMVVVGGSIAAGMITVRFKTFFAGLKSFSIAVKPPPLDSAGAIDTIVQLANTARKEGVLALEESAANMSDQFLKKGIGLIVDGTDPELVKGIMEAEIAYIEERHGLNASLYDNLASFAPSWGMIGTMIGLVLMLGNLDDPDSLGPMMSIALLTTFYGCILANYLFTPIAFKLKNISAEEILFKTISLEGMLSIQAGENPRIIEEKLKSFLAPALRNSVGGGSGGGGGEAAE